MNPNQKMKLQLIPQAKSLNFKWNYKNYSFHSQARSCQMEDQTLGLRLMEILQILAIPSAFDLY